jgi:hypothetical protein
VISRRIPNVVVDSAVELRFFGGMDEEETASALGVSSPHALVEAAYIKPPTLKVIRPEIAGLTLLADETTETGCTNDVNSFHVKRSLGAAESAVTTFVRKDAIADESEDLPHSAFTDRSQYLELKPLTQLHLCFLPVRGVSGFPTGRAIAVPVTNPPDCGSFPRIDNTVILPCSRHSLSPVDSVHSGTTTAAQILSALETGKHIKTGDVTLRSCTSFHALLQSTTGHHGRSLQSCCNRLIRAQFVHSRA